MPVYLIRAGESGPVKIGVADQPMARLATLQTAHYETLTLIREIEGSYLEETWLHDYFRPSHIRGEWHGFDPEMLTVAPPANIRECNTPFDVIRASRGMLSRIGAGLGITRSAVSQWQKVPAEMVVDVERITGIPRELLRPDLYRATPVETAQCPI